MRSTNNITTTTFSLAALLSVSAGTELLASDAAVVATRGFLPSLYFSVAIIR